MNSVKVDEINMEIYYRFPMYGPYLDPCPRYPLVLDSKSNPYRHLEIVYMCINLRRNHTRIWGLQNVENAMITC